MATATAADAQLLYKRYKQLDSLEKKKDELIEVALSVTRCSGIDLIFQLMEFFYRIS